MDIFEEKIAKRCSNCGGEPQYVHYYLSKAAGGGFEYGKDDEATPEILLKRLECIECGSTVVELVLRCCDAISYWNEEVDGHRLSINKYSTEKIDNETSSEIAMCCPKCSGHPQIVNYYIPKEVGGEFKVNELGEEIPKILLKRLECSVCGSTVAQLALEDVDAILYWNEIEDGHRVVIYKYGDEKVSQVEPANKVKTLEK